MTGHEALNHVDKGRSTQRGSPLHHDENGRSTRQEGSPVVSLCLQDCNISKIYEQIMVWCVVHDDVGEVAFFHHTVKGDHAWMRRCKLMQSNLSNVDLALTWGLAP